MASGKFNIAFSTIGTFYFPHFIKLISTFPIDRKYYGRCALAGLVSFIFTPFQWVEKLLYSKRLAQTPLPSSPVFILGHWRSGTTLLHNVMCKDDQFAYVTTYQSVFTNMFFGSRWLFKPFMKAFIPEKRPSDNVLLSPDFPQEEGFALSSFNSFSFYNFWYFPRQWKLFYGKYISCELTSETELQSYRNRYKKLIAQSILDQHKSEFISKNPVNTGRVKQILKMFPDARFIYLYRNPIMVFQSTMHFFSSVLDSLQLQDFSTAELEEMVFDVYKKIIMDYERQKSLIPKTNLVEIRYEDFIQRPSDHLETIYTSLHLKNYENALPSFCAYLDTQKRFEKNKHVFDQEQLSKIVDRLGFAMELYGYSSAEHMQAKG